MLAGRDEAKLTAEAAKLGRAADARCRKADVGKPGGLEALSAFAKTEFGRIDVLVNNAGSGMLGRTTTMAPSI